MDLRIIYSLRAADTRLPSHFLLLYINRRAICCIFWYQFVCECACTHAFDYNPILNYIKLVVMVFFFLRFRRKKKTKIEGEQHDVRLRCEIKWNLVYFLSLAHCCCSLNRDWYFSSSNLLKFIPRWSAICSAFSRFNARHWSAAFFVCGQYEYNSGRLVTKV